MNDQKVKILLVDDEPASVEQLANLVADGAEVKVVEPSDVTLDMLGASDLLLVDFALRIWPDRDSVSVLGLRPEDGLALAEVFRSALRAAKIRKPIAFAALTGELQLLTDPFPADPREHMVARSVNLEWAFQKKTVSEKLASQFLQLASAVQSLPKDWPHESSEKKDELLSELLGLHEELDWSDAALADVSKCHPPIMELSTWSHGLSFVRWLLHRILPYPCFLIDSRYTAARLRITHKSLLASLELKEPLSEKLNAVTYLGILNSFSETRWWRVGLDSIIWDLTSDDPFSSKVLWAKVKELAPSAEPIDIPNPVVCVDGDYRSTDIIADASDCVRLLPDDWPIFAEKGWARRSDVQEDERLKLVVIEEDQGLLERAPE